MPALLPTDFYAEIAFLGTVADRETRLGADARDSVMATFAGLNGECHGGLTRASCSRVRAQHPVGTVIRNTRQLAIVSAEELALAAAEVGLDRIDPAWLGTSIMLAGLPDLTHLPPSSRLQAKNGTTIVIDMENRPCVYPGKEEVAPHHAEAGRKLKSALHDRRGVTGWIEREGVLCLGDRLRLHVPDQDAWAGLQAARRATVS